jgi:hypothetical protein
MKSRYELISFLNDLENDLNVTSWQCNGVDIWPILRLHIAFQWFNKFEDYIANDGIEQVYSTSTIKRIKKKIILTIKGLTLLVRICSCKLDFVFFGSTAHRVNFKDRSMNRFFDPIMDQLETRGKKVFLLENNVSKNVYKAERTGDLSHITFGLSWVYRLFSRSAKNLSFSKEEISKLQQRIKKENLSIELAPILDSTNYFKFTKYIIKKIKHFNPNLKAAFFLCYYGIYDMVYAFNLSEIKTIDFQHGPATDTHPAYGNWNNVPKRGFNTMPYYFWTWNQESITAINKWSKGNCKYHHAFAGGHPWINYCLSFVKNKDVLKKKILISLQPDGEFLPEWSWKYLKNLQSDHDLFFRLHPRMKFTTCQVAEIIKKKGIINPNVDEATRTALPLILAQTNLHITRFSGVTIEAVLFNVPTLLLDKRGKDNFHSYIKEGIAAYTKEYNFKKYLDFFLAKDINRTILKNGNSFDNYLKIIEENILL